MIFKKVKVMPK